jgi:hypothetical protein
LSRARARAQNPTMNVRFRAWLLCGLLALAPAPVAAQNADEATRTAARALGTAGVEAYQANDFATATDKLEKAYALLHAPSLALWSGRALVKVGKWVEAAERFLEATSLQVPAGDYAVQKQAQSDAAAELAALRPRIPTLVVEVQGAALADCAFTVDGQAVAAALLAEGRLVNPGGHVIEARHGSEQTRAEVTVAEGERKTVRLEFVRPVAVAAAPVAVAEPAPAPSAPPPKVETNQASAQRTWGFVALGAGGVGLVVGGISGLVALGKKGDLDDNPNCHAGACAPSEKSAVDSYNSLRTVSTVGLFAGGGLAALGAVLLVTAPSGASAQAFVGPRSVGLKGSF